MGAGKRVAGAKVKLWWGRSYATEAGGEHDHVYATILDEYTTTENGWFVFRGLWQGSEYGTELRAWAHTKAEAHVVVGKSGETHGRRGSSSRSPARAAGLPAAWSTLSASL